METGNRFERICCRLLSSLIISMGRIRTYGESGYSLRSSQSFNLLCLVGSQGLISFIDQESSRGVSLSLALRSSNMRRFASGSFKSIKSRTDRVQETATTATSPQPLLHVIAVHRHLGSLRCRESLDLPSVLRSTRPLDNRIKIVILCAGSPLTSCLEG